VTAEYIDLNARRAALAGQLTQYMRIMEKAETVSEILEVQEQIERVQVEIDRIDGRLKYLDNRVDYATITVSLQEPEPVGGNEGFSFVGVINEGIAGLLGGGCRPFNPHYLHNPAHHHRPYRMACIPVVEGA